MARVVRLVVCVLVAILAAASLRDHRQPEAAPIAPELLGVPEGDQALAVAEALADAGAEGLSAGFELLDAPAPAVRSGAAAYLGRQGSRRAVPHLIRLLHDEAPQVRIAAAQALGAIGDRQALPFLERSIRSEPLDVAEAALLAARRIHALRDDSDG